MTPLLAAILTGAYIPNATVQYLPGHTVQTDMTGRYTTPKLPAGFYGLRISAPGFLIGRVSLMPMSATKTPHSTAA
jgi:mannosyltransferase OCH1-like enzyme